MSDRDCFDFIKSINRDKKYFLDKGWTPKYWFDNIDRNARWWPESYKDELECDLNDTYIEWFPPGFKLVKEGLDYDNDIYPEKCCINCLHAQSKHFYSEHAYGCRLPEVRVAHDSSILKGKEHICPGHSNPVFVWSVKFAPHAVCDYFEPYVRELNYQI